MKKLAIGGVPEHFNLPWHRLLETAPVGNEGIELTWRDFPDGSGAMAAALTNGELDVAMLLTEGAVAGIAQGGKYAIVSLYTESPLTWGIHVPASSSVQNVADVQGRVYAISRLGSGSHLMCYVHARQNRWPVDDLKFLAVRSLQGAIDAFARGQAEVFFWEKFMTKPVVDAGHFRRVGELVAPWPAFVVCASHAALSAHRELIAALLPRVFAQAAWLANTSDGALQIADRYGLALEDVGAWLRITRWASEAGIAREVVANVVGALREVGLIGADFDPGAAIAPLR